MTPERLNELLTDLDKELNDANVQLSRLIDEGTQSTDMIEQIEYWTTEISRITTEMQALLQSL